MRGPEDLIQRSSCQASSTDYTKASSSPMKSLAITRTAYADRHREVGETDQITVTTNGRMQGAMDPPAFPAITLRVQVRH